MTPPNVVSGQARTSDFDRPVGFFRPHALTVLEFPRVLDVDLFHETRAPDAFLHEEPSYVTWTPKIHRAPGAA